MFGLRLPILLLALAGAVYAQAHRSILLGQVKDRSGAVVANAPIKVQQRETNLQWNSTTNESGNWEVPGLLPGALVQIPSRAKFGNGRRLDRTRLRSRSQRGSPDLRHRRPCPA